MSAIDPEPLVGWRLWRVKEDGLHSWAVNHIWQPGENRADCLADGPYRCPQPPGKSCRCGFWALYRPLEVFALASAKPSSATVMGLVSAFGTVALHGAEGC